MKFLAVIPARYASSRLPGKPLKDIEGQSMIERVYRRAASVIGDICVATDDERIKAAVESFGGVAIMTSVDHRSGTDRVAEALDKYESMTGEKFDAVVNVQGDEPLIALEHLELVETLFDDPSTQIATLVKPFAKGDDIANPNHPKVVIANDGTALYFSRSVIPFVRGRDIAQWSECSTYYKHIGLYAYRSEVLRRITHIAPSLLEKAESLEQLRWLENGFKIKVAVTNTETVSVDTEEDLEKVRQIIRAERL